MTNTTKKTSTQIMQERMSAGFPGGIDRATQAIAMNEMPMTVTLNELRPSDVLPRFKRNELYDDIKSSIREKGLDHAPVITNIPGQPGYVISDGGNTRLQILNELYDETGDQKFFTINCLFRPWRGELKSIIGHLTENGLRDDYTFIEKAVGISKSKALYESETGKSLSTRELSERLKKDGYPISHVLLSKMLSTIEFLYPYIPEILQNGLGKPQIEKILQLRTVCLDLYHRSGKFDDETAFNEGFNLVLSGFDLEPGLFNYTHLQDEMFGFFAKTLDIKYNVFEFSMQEKQHNGKPLPPIDIKQPEISIPATTQAVSVGGTATANRPKETDTANSGTLNINGPCQLDGKSESQDAAPLPFTNQGDIPSDILSDIPGVGEFCDKHETGTILHGQSVNDSKPVELPYTIAENGDIVAKAGVDFKTAVEAYQNNTDFAEMFPRDHSLTLRLNTFDGVEKMPIVDIWKLPKQMMTHEYVFSDIAGHVFDILRELQMDNQTMAPFAINRETRETHIGFNPLTDLDSHDPVKRTAYTLLVSLLSDDIGDITLDLHHFVRTFNDFVVIKFLRIIRLKRVYDQFLRDYASQQ